MNVINRIQKEILLSFGDVLESEQFYLTGGTALSEFYLKHRKSNDLDFFTSTEELIIPYSYRLEGFLKNKGMSVQRQRGFRSFVEVVVSWTGESTVIHLALETPFRFEPTKLFPEYPKLRVDNLVDIASNKLLALFGRATLRDFIDVYFLINKGYFSPEELIAKAKEKDLGFDLYWLGVALERIKTFKDNSPEMILLLEPFNFNDLLVFFNEWREKIAKELNDYKNK